MWILQGDLKTFLRATSDDAYSEVLAGNTRLPPLSTAQRITLCGQIALGMEHIADRGLTHRDLAARNVLLSPSLHLKVRQPLDAVSGTDVKTFKKEFENVKNAKKT